MAEVQPHVVIISTTSMLCCPQLVALKVPLQQPPSSAMWPKSQTSLLKRRELCCAHSGAMPSRVASNTSDICLRRCLIFRGDITTKLYQILGVTKLFAPNMSFLLLTFYFLAVGTYDKAEAYEDDYGKDYGVGAEFVEAHCNRECYGHDGLQIGVNARCRGG